jgi:excisionase family DNA binding protein
VTAADGPRWLTLGEVARALGIDAKEVARLERTGELPARIVGWKHLFNADDVGALVARRGSAP